MSKHEARPVTTCDFCSPCRFTLDGNDICKAGEECRFTHPDVNGVYICRHNYDLAIKVKMVSLCESMAKKKYKMLEDETMAKMMEMQQMNQKSQEQISRLQDKIDELYKQNSELQKQIFELTEHKKTTASRMPLDPPRQENTDPVQNTALNKDAPAWTPQPSQNISIAQKIPYHPQYYATQPGYVGFSEDQSYVCCAQPAYVGFTQYPTSYTRLIPCPPMLSGYPTRPTFPAPPAYSGYIQNTMPYYSQRPTIPTQTKTKTKKEKEKKVKTSTESNNDAVIPLESKKESTTSHESQITLPQGFTLSFLDD
jgi:exonuclease VII large subunit